ncbi:MAG: Spo0B domain-containing protein [bacterium]
MVELLWPDWPRLVQLQRHDFLNHLQVLGALVQLDKRDRALAYIASVSQDLDQERLLARYLPSEVGLVLMSWFHRLRSLEIPVKVDFTADFSTFPRGAGLGALLAELLNLLLGDEPAAAEVRISGFDQGSEQVLELRVLIRHDKALPDISALEALARDIPVRLSLETEGETCMLAVALQRTAQVSNSRQAARI